MDGTRFLALTSGLVSGLVVFLFSYQVMAHEAHDDLEEYFYLPNAASSCVKANSGQLDDVNRGKVKKEKFLDDCAKYTNNSRYCDSLTRPNPASYGIFQCTYGENQEHILVHPDESTWEDAYQAVNLIEELLDLGIRVCNIYNWWRPEPYNQNVGGSASRHPYGTSVDVRFCSMEDVEMGLVQLCEWRKQGRLRALGAYGTTGVHFGVGDRIGNTWGNPCQ